MDNNAEPSIADLIDNAIKESKQAEFAPSEEVTGWLEIHAPSLHKNIMYFIDKQLCKAITHGHIREATHTLNNAAWRLRQLNKEVFAEWLEEQAQLKKINDKED